MYYEKIQAVIEAWKDDNDVMIMIKMALDACTQYVELVNNMETFIRTRQFHLDPDEFRESVMNLDRSRKFAHDNVISQITLLNKLATMKDLPKPYEGSMDVRWEIGQVAGDLAKEIFNQRKK